MEGSQYDFIVDDVIRMTNAVSGRERIVELRRLVEGVVNDTESVDALLDTLAALESDNFESAKELQAAVKKFPEKEFLMQCIEIFLGLADSFGDMTAYAQAGQHQSMLGTMATIETQVAELDQAIADNT